MAHQRGGRARRRCRRDGLFVDGVKVPTGTGGADILWRDGDRVRRVDPASFDRIMSDRSGPLDVLVVPHGAGALAAWFDELPPGDPGVAGPGPRRLEPGSHPAPGASGGACGTTGTCWRAPTSSVTTPTRRSLSSASGQGGAGRSRVPAGRLHPPARQPRSAHPRRGALNQGRSRPGAARLRAARQRGLTPVYRRVPPSASPAGRAAAQP
jgi:hypothetical protein